MAFQPAQNTCMVEIKWQGPGTLRWQNNLHFTKTDFDADDMDTLAEAIETAWAASDLLTVCSADILLGEVVTTDLRTQGATQRTLIVGEPGTSVSDMCAQGAALVATMRTDLRGRSYRGRFYMAGVADAFLENGEFTITVAGYLQAFLEAIQGYAAIGGWTLVVLSRWLNEVERLIALGEEVTDILIRALRPGSQRRRNQRP